MRLRTKYLGLELKNPIVVGASQALSSKIDVVKQLEDAGAAAIVMYSLFEEEIVHEEKELDHFLNHGTDSYAEALSYFPEPDRFANLRAEAYLEHLTKLKSTVDMPIIGSLNGVSEGGWMRYAQYMEEAGADALELNVYYLPTDFSLTAEQVETMYIDNLRIVKSAVTIPVAMKVSPFFSATANMMKKLDDAGADGLVLFNRFFGCDIDLEQLEVVPDLRLSTSYEMRLPLRWIGILYGNVRASLAASRGLRKSTDIIKMIMAGADATMLTSVLLEKGPEHITAILHGMNHWMDEHEYHSVEQMRGSMSYLSVSDPQAYERANYMKMLQSYL